MTKQIHTNSIDAHKEHESTGKGQCYRKRILALLAMIKQPLTDRQIIDTLHVTYVNNIRPEITRLKQRGLLVEKGKVKCPQTKHMVRTVVLAGVE